MKKMGKMVVVVGGGPAGTVAAIAAARNGADTLLVESTGCLGGMASAGLLSFWGAFDDRDRRLDQELNKIVAKGLPVPENLDLGKRIIKGIPEEILNRLIKLEGASDFGTGCIPINPEILKYVSEKMVIESGAKILYYTQVVDVIKEGNKIKGVVTASKAGLQKVFGDIFIDASGDADLSAFAGVPFEKGRSKDGRMSSVTLVFRLGNVNFSGRSYCDEDERARCDAIFKKEWEDGKLSSVYGVGCINSVPGMNGVVAVNGQTTNLIDGTNPEDLTKAVINGKKEVQEIAALYKRHLKGFENSFLIDTAFLLGVRETRRIVGEYVLTKEDVLGAKKFRDVICKYNWSIDVHMPQLPYRGPSSVPRSEDDVFLKPGTHFDIPYRCIIPKKIDNLLVAGRSLSSTQEAQGAARIMPCCMAMGQAAGTAAALSLKEKVIPRKLNISLLQDTLVKQKVCLFD